MIYMQWAQTLSTKISPTTNNTEGMVTPLNSYPLWRGYQGHAHTKHSHDSNCGRTNKSCRARKSRSFNKTKYKEIS